MSQIVFELKTLSGHDPECVAYRVGCLWVSVFDLRVELDIDSFYEQIRHEAQMAGVKHVVIDLRQLLEKTSRLTQIQAVHAAGKYFDLKYRISILLNEANFDSYGQQVAASHGVRLSVHLDEKQMYQKLFEKSCRCEMKS